MSPLIPETGSMIANRPSDIDLEYAASKEQMVVRGEAEELSCDLPAGCGLQMIEDALG